MLSALSVSLKQFTDSGSDLCWGQRFWFGCVLLCFGRRLAGTWARGWLRFGRIYHKWFVHPLACIHFTEPLSGPAHFARYVADIAPSLQALRSQPGSPGVFVHRLMFAVRYAGFQRRRMDLELQDAALDLVAMLHEDIAPKAWWGILLCDAVDFLQGKLNSWPCCSSSRLATWFFLVEQIRPFYFLTLRPSLCSRDCKKYSPDLSRIQEMTILAF